MKIITLVVALLISSTVTAKQKFYKWTDKDGNNMTIIEFISSRKFSIFFVLAIWIIVAILGFGSTKNCENYDHNYFRTLLIFSDRVSCPLSFEQGCIFQI